MVAVVDADSAPVIEGDAESVEILVWGRPMAANLLLNKMEITSKGAHRDSYRQQGDSNTVNHIAKNTNSNLNSNLNTNMTKHIQTSEDLTAIITDINARGIKSKKEAIQMALLNLIDGVNSGKVTPDNQRDYLLVLGLAWENFKKALYEGQKKGIAIQFCLGCTLRAIVMEALEAYSIDADRYESVVDGFINQIEKANSVYVFDDCLALIEWIKGEVCADLLRQFRGWLENERPDLLRFVGMSYSDISEEWDGAPIYMGNLPLLALKNRFYIGKKCYNIGDAMELDSFDIFEMMESLGDNHGHWDWVPDVVGGFFRSVA